MVRVVSLDKIVSPSGIIGIVASAITFLIPNPVSEVIYALVNIIPDGPFTAPAKPFLLLALFLIEVVAVAEFVENIIPSK